MRISPVPPCEAPTAGCNSNPCANIYMGCACASPKCMHMGFLLPPSLLPAIQCDTHLSLKFVDARHACTYDVPRSSTKKKAFQFHASAWIWCSVWLARFSSAQTQKPNAHARSPWIIVCPRLADKVHIAHNFTCMHASMASSPLHELRTTDGRKGLYTPSILNCKSF